MNPMPHLDSVCAEAREAPLHSVPGVQALWIGSTLVQFPKEWAAIDPAGDTCAAVVRDAWCTFWHHPFRLVENADGRQLVFWQAACLELGTLAARNGAGSGVRLVRLDVLGNRVDSEVVMNLFRLCERIIGGHARAPIEAGIRQCLVEAFARHSLAPELPRPFIEQLGARIETQLDARLDWPRASRELLQLALGSERACLLHDLIHPSDRRYPQWQLAFIECADILALWPDDELPYLPFVVPLAQSGVHAVTPAAVAQALHAHGLSRTAISRLHRLPLTATARMASALLDVQPATWPVFMQAINRFMAQVAQHATRGLEDDNVADAVSWLVYDAAATLLSGGQRRPALLTVDEEYAEHPPWPDSGRAEYATLRGFRPARALGPPSRRRHSQEGSLLLGEGTPLYAGPQRVGYGTAGDTAALRTPTEPAALRRLAQLLTVETLRGKHRVPGMENVLHDTFDWFRNAEPPTGMAQLRGTWGDVQRRQQRWHAEQQRLRADPDLQEVPAPAQFTSALEPLEIAPWRAIHVSDAVSLWQEGRAMEHCVYTYRDLCELGVSQIFSISRADTGERHGTAEFRRLGGQWTLVQFRGLKNRDPVVADEQEARARDALMAELAIRLAQAQSS